MKSHPECPVCKAHAEHMRKQAVLNTGKRMKPGPAARGPGHKDAKRFNLIDPEGTIYRFKNIRYFVDSHRDLFLPDDTVMRKGKSGRARNIAWCRAYAGLYSLFSKAKNTGSWKGWKAG